LISDGYGYQNRNKTLASDLSNAALMRKVCPKNPYTVKVVDYTFFKNYDNISTLTSIRPGSKKGNKFVSDIVYLKYVKNEGIYLKTDIDNKWEMLFQK